jgi:RNA polymerase sigma-70 factor (ECF subfamily)
MPPSSANARPLFVTTRWSIVLAARAGNSDGAALETLCRTYWYPLYAFVRSRGHAPADAQDLTQEFFARLLTRNYLDAVSPDRGRFRTFLRMALQRFLANEWDRARTRKRGGGCVHVPFDTAIAERRLHDERDHALPPDRTFDRRWAQALLDDAATRLETEYLDAGKAAEFTALKPHLTAGRGEIPYAEIAKVLQTTEGAARVAIHRLRRRFRERFREAVADTVVTPEEFEMEMREVLDVLGNR